MEPYLITIPLSIVLIALLKMDHIVAFFAFLTVLVTGFFTVLAMIVNGVITVVGLSVLSLNFIVNMPIKFMYNSIRKLISNDNT